MRYILLSTDRGCTLYKYGILRTDDSEEAQRHNGTLLGLNTLGIEVTRTDLAARCGLGNIDPQHGSNPQPDCSAILASLTYPLPPAGTTFVTIRPDADAFGAMAVLTARSEGKQNFLLHELVEAVHLIDCVGAATALAKNPRITEYKLECDAIQQLVRTNSSRVEERVLAVTQILTGVMPRHQIEEIASLRQRDDYSGFKQTIIVPDKVMLIMTKGRYGAARSYGIKRFPVTIICDFEYIMPGADGYTPHKRWCIARQESAKVIDMNHLKIGINRAEAQVRGLSVLGLEKHGLTWGGPRDLASSPQGKVSELSDDEIVTIVKQCTN